MNTTDAHADGPTHDEWIDENLDRLCEIGGRIRRIIGIQPSGAVILERNGMRVVMPMRTVVEALNRCSEPKTNLPPVLDACCGTRMMWFDKADKRALFVDKRSESFRPTGVKFADKDIEVSPDVQADFKALPFPNESFSLVVFDPPHVVRAELLGNVTKYYGALPVDWKSELRGGFAECFRVLKPHGTLIFKWCESSFPINEILKLTAEKPLFGHRSGKAAKTHWVAFIKQAPSPPSATAGEQP